MLWFWLCSAVNGSIASEIESGNLVRIRNLGIFNVFAKLQRAIGKSALGKSQTDWQCTYALPPAESYHV
jgi:hypothetical protein